MCFFSVLFLYWQLLINTKQQEVLHILLIKCCMVQCVYGYQKKGIRQKITHVFEMNKSIFYIFISFVYTLDIKMFNLGKLWFLLESLLISKCNVIIKSMFSGVTSRWKSQVYLLQAVHNSFWGYYKLSFTCP